MWLWCFSCFVIKHSDLSNSGWIASYELPKKLVYYMKVVFIGNGRRAHYLHLTITSFNSYLKCFWRTRSSSRYLSCLENSQQTFNTMETRNSRVLGGYFSNRILIFLFIPAQLVRCFAVRYFLNIYELLSSNVDTTAPLYACFRDRSVFPKNQAYRKERSFEEGQQIPVWVVSSEELVSVVCLSRWLKLFTRASGIPIGDQFCCFARRILIGFTQWVTRNWKCCSTCRSNHLSRPRSGTSWQRLKSTSISWVMDHARFMGTTPMPMPRNVYSKWIIALLTGK